MESVNITLWDILDCFHNILNAPRIYLTNLKVKTQYHKKTLFIWPKLPNNIRLGGFQMDQLYFEIENLSNLVYVFDFQNS